MRMNIFSQISENFLCWGAHPQWAAERSFSTLRRIKGPQRSTMGEERLSALALMSMHYAEVLALNPKEVAKEFIKQKPRKLFCNSIIFET